MALADTAKLVATLELKDKFSAQLGKATASLSTAEQKLGALERTSILAGRGLGVAANNVKLIGLASAAALTTAVGASVNAAVAFEDAFAGIRKTVSETELAAAGLTFEDLSDSIRKMAREIPIAATELSRIGEAAGALGIRAQDIDDFVRVVAELSVTTNLTSDQAAAALGHLGTILDLTGEDFRNAADSLVALGNAGASTEDQIVDIASRFAAAGRSAGLSTEDILALASATASMGIEAEAAGSSLSRVFSQVATNIGTSNAKAKAFASALGLSAQEFRDAWQKDALGTFDEFLAKLNTLDQFEAASLLQKVGITSTRDINAVRLMAQNVDDVNKALAVSRDATDALGIEARKKFETTASQLTILKNKFTDIGITIGFAVLPKINELVGKVGDFLEQPATQGAIKEFADSLPGLIDKAIELGSAVPWETIGASLQLAGMGANAVLDAFLSLPDWIQTAVITGWGLNKLTGGALGNIGGLAIKMVFERGATPANPLWVQTVGGIPGTQPPGPGPGGILAGPQSLLGKVFVTGIAVAGGLIIGKAVTDAMVDAGFAGIKPAKEFEQAALESAIDAQDVERIVSGINSIDENLAPSLLDLGLSLEDSGAAIANALDLGGVRSDLEADRQVLLDQLETMGLTYDQAVALVDAQKAMTDKYGTQAVKQIAAIENLHLPLNIGNALISQIKDQAVATKQAILTASSTAAGTANRMRENLANIQSSSAITAAKRMSFDPTINVGVNTAISVSNVTATLTSFRIAGSGTVGGFTESAF